MEKKNGAFGAIQFSLGTLVEGRPGTTIFQNLVGGGGGGWGGSHTKTRPRCPPPPGFMVHIHNNMPADGSRLERDTQQNGPSTLQMLLLCGQVVAAAWAALSPRTLQILFGGSRFVGMQVSNMILMDSSRRTSTLQTNTNKATLRSGWWHCTPPSMPKGGMVARRATFRLCSP